MKKTNKVDGQAFLDINSFYKDITMLKNCDIGIKIDQWNRIKSIKTYVFVCICIVNIIIISIKGQYKYTYTVACVYVFLINWTCRALTVSNKTQENKRNCSPDLTWRTTIISRGL